MFAHAFLTPEFDTTGGSLTKYYMCGWEVCVTRSIPIPFRATNFTTVLERLHFWTSIVDYYFTPVKRDSPMRNHHFKFMVYFFVRNKRKKEDCFN